MYRTEKIQNATSKGIAGYVGETIESKVRRIVNNKEPITDGAPLIYTERKDGLKPEYDIRTDRWEVAVDAMDKVAKSAIAKRENRMGQEAMKGMTEEQKAEYVKDKPNIQYTPPKAEGGSGEEGKA